MIVVLSRVSSDVSIKLILSYEQRSATKTLELLLYSRN